MIAKCMREKIAGDSAIRRMFEEGREMAQKFGPENVFDFSLGNPNVPAPSSVNKAIRAILDREDPLKIHGYMPNAGFEEARRAVALDLNQRYGTTYTGKNVILTSGAGGAMNLALKSVLDPGDEVVVFAPYFVEYRNYIDNYQAKIVEVPPFPDGSFLPDLREMQARITSRTKAVILNSPNNPTGVVYGPAVIRDLTEILRQCEDALGHPICLISDEPYRDLVFEGNRVPHLPDYYSDSVICYSFSKSLSLPGERIGYLLVSDKVHSAEDFISAATAANRHIGIVNAPSLMQLAIGTCLKEKADLGFYDENRKALYGGLCEAGYQCVEPQGAFYLWVKAPMGEEEFVKALKEERILVTPGSAFAGPGYVRLAYCVSRETIDRAMPGFQRVMERAGETR